MTRRMPAGAPVALLALAAYAAVTLTMPWGAVRTATAALLPLAGLAVTVALTISRLRQVGADQEETRRMFERAGAFVMASPVLALAVHMTG